MQKISAQLFIQRAVKKTIFAVLIIMFCIAEFSFIGLRPINILYKTSFIITQNHMIFMLLRWLMLIIFFVSWSWFVKKRAKQYSWSKSKTNYWLHQKLKIIIWLILFELLVCENLLWQIFHWI